ncbi:MAG: MarR family transcriptional regulator [Gammaproteobacteria bacterium]|jgi:MarR family transcriptional regulator for hemolysin|nr:MarR family transcriptional regulator [Gammaproteobacteria bacterium]
MASREYSLGFLLADILRLIRTEFRRQATGLQLTPALARLLLYVDRRPGCSQTELAAYLDLTSATVGRMIDRLEAGGFLRRLPDASDRRAFRIHLDAAAGPLIERMHSTLDRTLAKALRGIPPAEQAALRSTLERIRGNLATEGG